MCAPIPPEPLPAVTVVGLTADGWSGLPEAQRQLVLGADVLVGGRRHLALVPPRPHQRRELWPSPLRERLVTFLAGLGAGEIVLLASGDPLVSGVGTTLVDLLGADRVRVLPALSSVALARAELRWPAESHAVVSVVGRATSLVLRELAPGRRVLVLSADERTPAEVAELLRSVGYGASTMHVLGDLGSADFSRIDGTASTWSAASPRLNVIGLALAGPPRGAWTAGLPDHCFEQGGRPGLRDARASALARLAPVPGEHLWDVGAGPGWVGIEWMRAHPTCSATAVEPDARRAEGLQRNAAALGVPTLRVVRGVAPGALDGLPAPSAVFVHGGAATDAVVERCLAALVSGGRLVVQGTTPETAALLRRLHGRHGGELVRISVEVATPGDGGTGWAPSPAVTQWAFTRDS